MNRSLVLVLLALGASSGTVPAGARQRLSFDPGWRFVLADPANAEQPGFDDHGWRIVDVPHDWSIEGVMQRDTPAGGRGAFLPTGVAWYRKTFQLPASAAGREASLEFDGVYMNSDVWLNGVHLGHRPYGYSSFSYDISGHLAPGLNIVAVRVDNSLQPNSRWYSGSGIDRHVWLTLTDSLHVAHWGTVVTTPQVDSAHALVAVRTAIMNDRATPAVGVLRIMLVDASGREVARSESPFTIGGRAQQDVVQQLSVATPHLWSDVTPYLYSVRTAVLAGDAVVDTVATAVGIRSIAFDKDEGFLLNGHRVKLRGVNLHEDGGGLGAAVPEQVWASRLALLRAMGANAIRTSHNPPAPEFLDLCDQLGFLVMAEAFDEWTVAKVPQGYHQYFADWSERDVTDFVHRDRNHPSIVLWSAGNEIGEQSMPGGDQVLRRLVDLFHREDPTRPVTTGNDQIAADGHPATIAFLEAEDIVGYNYVDRWHERRELFADEDRHAHPDWRMVGTESGSIFESFDERPSLGTDPARVEPNYTSGMLQAERRWKWVSLHDYFAGDFMWTGVDYLGEATWPFRGFPSGVLDITGHPKDSYYLYQSLWTSEPVLHLLPHWNWPGRKGQVVPVLAYTNCNSVELFLNGRSLGEKRLEFPAQGTSGGWNSYALPIVNPTTNDLHLSWDVPYEPGVLRAVGKRRDGASCHDEMRTAGAPAAVRLIAERDPVSAGPGDVALVRFEIVDASGTVVPTAGNLVRLTVRGGRILALDNGDLRDQGPYRNGTRHAFGGRGLAVVRASAAGTLRLSASAAGLRSAELSIRVTPGAVVPAVPGTP